MIFYVHGRLMDLTLPFYNYNRPGSKASQGVRDEAFWSHGLQAGVRGATYASGSHGPPVTERDEFNTDLLAAY